MFLIWLQGWELAGYKKASGWLVCVPQGGAWCSARALETEIDGRLAYVRGSCGCSSHLIAAAEKDGHRMSSPKQDG